MPREKEPWEEEAEKFAEEEYDMLEFKFEGEDWWKTLKKKWKKEGIKEFLYEYARRCLLHKPHPKDYKAYDYEKALEESYDYAMPSKALYNELMMKGLFPPPPEEEAQTEALKEEAKSRHERLQYYLKKIEEEGLTEDLKEALKAVDYKKLYDETRKKLKKLEEIYETKKREYEEILRKYAEATAEKYAISEEFSRRIWREWAKKPQKPKMDYFQLIEIMKMLIDECMKRYIDPNAIKIEEVLSPYLTFEENKKNVLKKLEEYKALPPEEAEKLRRELEEWKRRAEEAEKKYLEEKKKEEEALKPPKPILGDREYEILLKEFLDQVEDRVILSRELREALQRIFKLEWEANKIAYMDFRSAEDFMRDLAEKWAKMVEAELKEYKGLIPKVEAEAEKKIVIDYEKLAREIARRMEGYMPREYVPPTLIPEIPEKPTQPIPREPISEWRGPFPRMLTNEEYTLFWKHYAWELWRQGINPYSLHNQEIFVKGFRDLEYKSWGQVLERFKLIIKCALEGLPPPPFPPPELIFEEIPREPVIYFTDKDSHNPIDEQAKNLEVLTEYIKEEAMEVVPPEEREKIEKLTPEDVRKILEEEYAKGEKCHMMFKPLLEKKNYLWNILKLKDLEEDAKWTTLAGLWEGTKSLRDLVNYAKNVHGYRVTEDDVRRWIREELEKPPEKAHIKIRLYRWKSEELLTSSPP